MVFVAGRREGARHREQDDFLPLKNSSVVFGLGPSAVITVNVAFGQMIADLDGHELILSSLGV